MPRMVILAALLAPASVSAQDVRGAGYYKNYGYAFGPWQKTRWDALEFRTRCDGEQVRGANTGPIKWTIEYRNRSGDPVSFDYLISPPGANRPAVASGKQSVKAGKSFQKLAIVPTTRCDEGVQTAINNVRFGPEEEKKP